MANIPDHPIHWQFAAASAFDALENQVRGFDFARDAGRATYSGLTPQYYLSVIDGFLAEDESVVPGGNRRALDELRKLIVHHYLAAFDCGWHTAIEAWNKSSRKYGSVPTEELHAMARKSSPFGSVKCEWFIEGFCQSWAKTEMESLRPT